MRHGSFSPGSWLSLKNTPDAFHYIFGYTRESALFVFSGADAENSVPAEQKQRHAKFKGFSTLCKPDKILECKINYSITNFCK
jgi:hypothetical protein